MIELPQQNETDPRRALAAHLRRRIDAAATIDPVVAEAVADSVAALCCATGDSAMFRDQDLDMMLAGALAATGQSAAADSICAGRLPDAFSLRSDWMRAPSVWPLMRGGLLRPARWETIHHEPLWMLDLSRMTPGPDDCSELSRHAALRRIAGAIAPLWDQSQGRGRLVVSGCEPDTPAWLGEFLLAEGATRGWTEAPEIVRIEKP